MDGFSGFGFPQRIRVRIKAKGLGPGDLEATALDYLETLPDGTLLCDWRTRSMKRSDDESMVFRLNYFMSAWFGTFDGWQIDWENSSY